MKINFFSCHCYYSLQRRTEGPRQFKARQVHKARLGPRLACWPAVIHTTSLPTHSLTCVIQQLLPHMFLKGIHRYRQCRRTNNIEDKFYGNRVLSSTFSEFQIHINVPFELLYYQKISRYGGSKRAACKNSTTRSKCNYRNQSHSQKFRDTCQSISYYHTNL